MANECFVFKGIENKKKKGKQRKKEMFHNKI